MKTIKFLTLKLFGNHIANEGIILIDTFLKKLNYLKTLFLDLSDNSNLIDIYELLKLYS